MPPLRKALPLLVLVAWAPTAAAGPLTHEPCEDARAAEAFISTTLAMENLAFDGAGALYVSAKGVGVLAITPAGDARTFAPADAHGIVWRDALYVNVPAAQGRAVLRYEPDGTFETLVEGLPAHNGMAFDAEGNLYVSRHNTRPSIVRVPAGAPHEWAPWSDVYGANGLAYDGGNASLLVAVSLEQSSRILRISLADPSDVRTVATLSLGGVSLEPGVASAPDPSAPARPKALDDLTLGPDGNIYAAAFATGEILRVDPRDGRACVVAADLQEPSSVRVARGFGPYDGDLFVTAYGGTTGMGPLVPVAPPVQPAEGRPGLFRIPLGLALPGVGDDAASREPPHPQRAAAAPHAIVALLAAGLLARLARR
ncbi:MAG TPA: hypothetical protein VM582_09855 [Candidatus Thermoplasmatota archaeon]|nr:hypothetical protein [Candidatus Thermoplasmatota archaeon]